jgi:DNA-binding MarR family transcriptional regulator
MSRSEKDEASHQPKLGKVLEFLRLLWAVDHGFQRASKRMHANLGVTALQRMMIRIVGRALGISTGDLAEMLHVHPSTLTGALDKLVRSGALLRKVDPDDARRALLYLGAKGKTIDAVRTGTVEAAVRKAFAKLSEEQIEHAAEVLQEIARALDEESV